MLEKSRRFGLDVFCELLGRALFSFVCVFCNVRFAARLLYGLKELLCMGETIVHYIVLEIYCNSF